MKLKYILAALLTFIISPAHAELEIDVRGATRNPMPIAIPANAMIIPKLLAQFSRFSISFPFCQIQPLYGLCATPL